MFNIWVKTENHICALAIVCFFTNTQNDKITINSLTVTVSLRV